MKHDVRRFAGAGVLLLALVILMAGCAGTRLDLEGAWECVQPPPLPGQTPTVKVLADGHFAFGTMAADGRTLRAGGGTYGFADGKYVETITYHWAQALVGQVVAFDGEVEDGLWHHRATFEAGGEPFHIDETWRRLGEPKPGK